MRRYLTPAIVAALLVGALAAWYLPGMRRGEPVGRSSGEASGSRPVDEATIRRLCSYCHRFPDPDALPRSAWGENVRQMAQLPLYGNNVSHRPSPKSIAAWYEQRAPEELPLAAGPADVQADSLRLHSWSFSPENPPGEPTVSHVQLVDLLGDGRLELLVCDMRSGLVLLGRPYVAGARLTLIASVPHPARAEVVDLDGDGRRDILVANLGSFPPIDHNLGSVEWLKQTGDGRFQRVTLAGGLGRVADVRAIDFDADGDLDLAVAEFGWRTTGRVLVLQNRTGDRGRRDAAPLLDERGENHDQAASQRPRSSSSATRPTRPRFEHHVIDRRHGAIHVPITDLNGDGRPDFLALLAQEHEMVVAYLNGGGFQFEPRELYQAPHPAWGSSGMQLIDPDQDGDLDILLTNGDTLDDGRAKPYHAIQWLENLGQLRFQPHRLATMYGVHRAEAGDLDGDGDLDIAACAYLDWNHRPEARYVGLMWLEQMQPGEFREHVLEAPESRHMTLSLGDYDGDGDVDLAVGNSSLSGEPPTSWVDVLENRMK